MRGSKVRFGHRALLRIFGFASLALLSISAALAPVFSPTAIIATWNLGGFPAQTEEEWSNISRAIYLMRPDVIAVQEVTPATGFQTLAAKLKKRGLVYRIMYMAQEPLPDGRKLGRDFQMVGFLYRPQVKLSNIRVVPGSNDGNDRLRNAIAADVRVGSFDFTLVNVHLKAGRKGYTVDNGAGSIRNRQCAAISTFLKAQLAGADRDVLLVGDYNMIPREDQRNFDALGSAGVSLKFVSDSFYGRPSHINAGGVGNLLDGYAIESFETSEYIPGSERLLSPKEVLPRFTPEKYVNSCTDHLPLLAAFRIDVDDD